MLAGSRKRVLGVFAHPDDEVLFAGGLLALCAQSGAEVTVVCATRGEAGTCRDKALLALPLADVRAAELAAACRMLGAKPPILLDLPDAGLADIGVDAAAALVADLLRTICPDLVVTAGLDGGYGHRDHIAVTGFVSAAMERAGAQATCRLLHAVFPRGLFTPLWQRLRRLGLCSPLAAGQMGVLADSVDLVLPIEAVRARKWQALAAHRSQLDGGDPRTFLLPGLVDERSHLFSYEWYVIASGPRLPRDAHKADLFAGL